MSKPIYIYALKDPRDGLFFYVGSSINPRGRWSSFKGCYGGSDAARFCKRLKVEGYAPELAVLCEVDDANRYASEQSWIDFLRDGGHPLKNQIPAYRTGRDVTRLARAAAPQPQEQAPS